MSNVTLSIAGRNYTVACADGDEERVRDLAAMIGERLAGIGASLNNPMEAKNLLIASLILADELDEARKDPPPPPPAVEPPTAMPGLAEELEALAERLEKTAEALESGAPTS